MFKFRYISSLRDQVIPNGGQKDLRMFNSLFGGKVKSLKDQDRVGKGQTVSVVIVSGLNHMY